MQGIIGRVVSDTLVNNKSSKLCGMLKLSAASILYVSVRETNTTGRVRDYARMNTAEREKLHRQPSEQNKVTSENNNRSSKGQQHSTAPGRRSDVSTVDRRCLLEFSQTVTPTVFAFVGRLLETYVSLGSGALTRGGGS